DGGVIPFAGTSSEHVQQILEGLAHRYGLSDNLPLREWPEEPLDVLLHGASKPIPITYVNRQGRKRSYDAHFEGVIPWLKRRYNETGSQGIKDDLEQYMTSRPCATCKGFRLKKESLAVTVADLNISQVTAFSIGRADRFFSELTITERE